MFCSIYKWFISQAEDSRKPLPVFVNRHIQRCASCREFIELHESLVETSVKDLPCISDEKISSLAINIISALDSDKEPGKPPAKRTALIPVFVSSFVLLAVAAGIYFLTSPQPSSTHLLMYCLQVSLVPIGVPSARLMGFSTKPYGISTPR